MRFAIIVLLAGCNETVADPKPGSCEAVAKSSGKPLVAWKAPADCAIKPSRGDALVLAKEADARAHIECKDPKTKLGVDFTKRQLVVTTRSYSPAQVGLDVYDDGKKITFVSRQRSPCPNDPRPMPGPDTTLVFDAPTGARTFAESSCNIEQPKCK